MILDYLRKRRSYSLDVHHREQFKDVSRLLAGNRGYKFSDASRTRLFYERVEQHRYSQSGTFRRPRALPHKSRKVLEIGVDWNDGAQFAKAGADYTGIDLTDAAVELARRRLSCLICWIISGIRRGKLDFPSDTFDWSIRTVLIIHLTRLRAVEEVRRVLNPVASGVMLYHRDLTTSGSISEDFGGWSASVAVRVGLKLVHRISGEPLDSLRKHALLLKAGSGKLSFPGEFLSQHTDGAGTRWRVFIQARSERAIR